MGLAAAQPGVLLTAEVTAADNADARPVALVTGASRTAGIGGAVGLALAADGWDVALTYWRPYDERMPWGEESDGVDHLDAGIRAAGGRSLGVEADLSRPETAEHVFSTVEGALGPVQALVMCHCESVSSDILSTTVESFDRHMAVNTRASWLSFGRSRGGTGVRSGGVGSWR